MTTREYITAQDQGDESKRYVGDNSEDRQDEMCVLL